MFEHLVPACVAYCQQERKLHDGDLDYEARPLEYHGRVQDWGWMTLRKKLTMA
jgi:hypothetical protein